MKTILTIALTLFSITATIAQQKNVQFTISGGPGISNYGIALNGMVELKIAKCISLSYRATGSALIYPGLFFSSETSYSEEAFFVGGHFPIKKTGWSPFLRLGTASFVHETQSSLLFFGTDITRTEGKMGMLEMGASFEKGPLDIQAFVTTSTKGYGEILPVYIGVRAGIDPLFWILD